MSGWTINRAPVAVFKKRSPERVIFPGASTMIRFDENGVAIGVTRDLLRLLSRDAHAFLTEAVAAAEKDAKRVGFMEGHAAATGAPAVRGGAL